MQNLALRMHKIGITEEDLIEKFVLGSGSGGQKINKTSSCVYLQHLPSGFEVKCQRSRSREANRLLAREELCEKIEAKLLQERFRKLKQKSVLRVQNRRPSKTQKTQMVESKRRLSAKKSYRKIPRHNDQD